MRALAIKQSQDMLTQRKCLILFYLFEFEQNVRNAQCRISRISNQETKRREIFTFFKSYGNEKDSKTGSGH